MVHLVTFGNQIRTSWGNFLGTFGNQNQASQNFTGRFILTKNERSQNALVNKIVCWDAWLYFDICLMAT